MFEFYKGKRVLVTGYTGFKGSWLSLWLYSLGADVYGCALEPETELNLFDILKLDEKINSKILDIRNKSEVDDYFDAVKPEIVFHLAAQPLVRRSYDEPVLTYETNIMGSLNVLEAARKCQSMKSFVNVTTDKCYENKEVSVGYKEDDPMGGYDMYSSSKGCVEIMSASYRRCFLNKGQVGAFPMATARAGNVIGGGDWATDRLVPDCARAISSGSKIEIRNPNSVRPWQHVLEPLCGYLILGEKLYENGYELAQGFNFGPNEKNSLTVKDVVEKFVSEWGKGEIIVKEDNRLHEAGLLMLNIDKVQKVLGWSPLYDADRAISLTTQWYKKYYEKEDMFNYTLAQIRDFERAWDGKTFA